MKTLIKLTLVVCLFASVVLADGEMGNGNRNCNGPVPCLAAVTIEEKGDKVSIDSKEEDTIFQNVRDYLTEVLESLIS